MPALWRGAGAGTLPGFRLTLGFTLLYVGIMVLLPLGRVGS
jgi:hypothetical protein